MEEYAFVCGGRFHEQLLYLKKKRQHTKKNRWMFGSTLLVYMMKPQPSLWRDIPGDGRQDFQEVIRVDEVMRVKAL